MKRTRFAPDLRAARPVELLRERDRKRRRLDPGDLHAPSSFRPRSSTVDRPLGDSRDDLALARLEGFGSCDHLDGVCRRNDSDTVCVGADEVAGVHGHAGELHGDADLARAGLAGAERRAAEMEHRQSERCDRVAVADRAVDDDACDAPRERGASDQVAAVRDSPLASDRNDQYVAARRGRDGVVKRETVGGGALHGQRSTGGTGGGKRGFEAEDRLDARAAGRRQSR